MDERIILLVEDNADDEALTIRALKSNRIRNPVIVAHDGAEALDYLFGDGSGASRKLEKLPSIVLLDLKLPKVDGLEVLKRMRTTESTRLLPVIVLTSSKEEVDLLNSYRGGCNSYICKPVDCEKFYTTVGELGLYWLVVNEAPPVVAG